MVSNVSWGAQYSQLVERSDCANILSTGVVSFHVLCAVWGSIIQKIRMCPEEGNSDDERICEERMRILRLFSWEKRRLRSNFITIYSFLMREDRKCSVDLWCLVIGCERWLKAASVKFRLDSSKEDFSERVLKHLDKFPREVVTDSSLLVFNKYSDNAFIYKV